MPRRVGTDPEVVLAVTGIRRAEGEDLALDRSQRVVHPIDWHRAQTPGAARLDR